MSEWQPIETALRDERQLLLAWRDGEMCVGEFMVDKFVDSVELRPIEPDFWMSLPAPPFVSNAPADSE